MSVDSLIEYIFIYTPLEDDIPIAYVAVHIVAETRKEAELIAMKYNHVFFDRNCKVIVREGLKGYRDAKSS